MKQVTGFDEKIEQIVSTHLDDDSFGIKKLCQILDLSRMQIHRKIKQTTNLSISIFIQKIRLEKSKNLLLQTEKTIRQIAFEVGFNNPAYYSKLFKKHYKMQPRQMRKKRQNN